MSKAKFYHLLRIIGIKKIHFNFPTNQKVLYLTFDDGPNPEVTPNILRILKEHNIKTTFFCIGKNIELFPEIFSSILSEGHIVGNHTFNHLNGWKTKTKEYINDVEKCEKLIKAHQPPSIQPSTDRALYIPIPLGKGIGDGLLFRPPYGKITPSQYRILKNKYKIILWDVLSWDFKKNITPNKIFERIIKQGGPGSIIVFHETLKAKERVVEVLPKVINYFQNKGFVFIPFH